MPTIFTTATRDGGILRLERQPGDASEFAVWFEGVKHWQSPATRGVDAPDMPKRPESVDAPGAFQVGDRLRLKGGTIIGTYRGTVYGSKGSIVVCEGEEPISWVYGPPENWEPVPVVSPARQLADALATAASKAAADGPMPTEAYGRHVAHAVLNAFACGIGDNQAPSLADLMHELRPGQKRPDVRLPAGAINTRDPRREDASGFEDDGA
jgi:hypothetical protein